MTSTLENRICEGYQPIPGYALEEMIGRGGFGEVWRASAPGGLKKAVKFVFGTQDSERSQRERRSLERIRGVQHPFLLTLERFEAIENQLVIVTELADGSLEDVFKEHQQNGSCGIPRETLIRHMHDTADALDYLHEKYQLQHLDVKPGNLLIVGGHVKVADFGLLKDLRDAECSIVGGLTPVYAPPELFDGKPSLHSDQYSLAVMYQELLTGTRPFHGRTIAQLATQHVHSAPNLEPLPPADRPAVARALEKNPEMRFDSCTSFVDALKYPRSAKIRLGSDDNDGTARPLDDFNHIGTVEDLPQLPDRDGAGPVAQEYALVVALGGTGADCLRSLRRRASEKHHDGRLGLHSVLIDTDSATLDSMRDADPGEQAGPCELIGTPLKTAKEYRSTGTDRLRTVSRRWIYNVPRSTTTEGLRPLGRLALVDHGPSVAQRLSAMVHTLAAASRGATPHVYVVGSLTGGTSSGMYLDVVHLLRHLLDEHGLEIANIISMLTTVPMQADPGYPLALYDAHAALIEMNHFLNAGNGYPGDPGAGWPSVPAARTPLHQVYVIAEPTTGSLGPSPVETITDYVWTDATGAGSLLESARNIDSADQSALRTPTLHSVGVVPLSDLNRVREKTLAPGVARELLMRWLGLPAEAKKAAAEFSPRVIRRCQAAPETIMQVVGQRIRRPEHQSVVSKAIFHIADHDRSDFAAVAGCLAGATESMGDEPDFRSIASDVMARFMGELSTAISDRVIDVTSAIESMAWIQQVNQSAVQQLRSPEFLKMDGSNDAIEQAACRLVTVKVLLHINECLVFLQQRLERFASTLALGIVQAKKLQGTESNPWDAMPEQVGNAFDSAVIDLHGAMVSQFVVRTLVDHSVNVDAGAMVGQLHDAAVTLVERIVEALDRSAAADNSLADPLATPDPQATLSMPTAECLSQTAVPAQVQAMRRAGQALTVDEAIVAVKPALLEFGGQQRLILIVGNDLERQQLEEQVRAAHAGSVTVSVVPGAAPKLIHEARQIELSSILTRLRLLNGDNTVVTGRLSSRNDITW